MQNADAIEAGAEAMWQTDPRVNQVPWSRGDAPMKDNYRIYASAVITAAERVRKN
jgi:hypothetical protein